MNIRQTNQKGFTLIELLVVIGILALLVVGAIVALNPVQKFNATKDATTKSNMDQVVAALNSYYAVNQAYPANLAALVTSGDLKQIPTAADGAVWATNANSKYEVNAGKTNADIQFTLLASTDSANFPTWCWTSLTGKTYQPNIGSSGTCTAP